jgi:hypothetical protein
VGGAILRAVGDNPIFGKWGVRGHGIRQRKIEHSQFLPDLWQKFVLASLANNIFETSLENALQV